MDCPKCNSVMEEVEFGGVVVDRCTSCKGIWFDALEHEELKKMKKSHKIDTGKEEVGLENDKIGNINCPRCNVKMIKMVDKDQPHIWYEKCSSCDGVYFDAGEFKDYKKENFMDKIKDLFTPERK